MDTVLLTKDAIKYTNVAVKNNVTEIFNTYRGKLLAFIRKRTRTVEDAEDILQDVFFQLAEAGRFTKPIDHMAAWLYTVARHRIIDLYRKKKTEPLPFLSNDDDSGILDELDDLLFDDGSTPETEYLKAIVWSELNNALSRLPPEQKVIFELTEIKGLSFKEISLQTGLPVNTLISRKHYAVLYLRERLQELYDELENED